LDFSLTRSIYVSSRITKKFKVSVLMVVKSTCNFSHMIVIIKLFFLQTISSSPALFRQLTCERRETKQTEREGIFSEVSDDGQRLGERGCLK